jgi:hypothetical protein
MVWKKPEDVTSPKKHWKLDSVLYDAGEGCPSIALGTLMDGDGGNTVIAIRWNGTNEEGKKNGNPQSTGYATWFVLPDAVAIVTLRMLSEKLARGNPNVHSAALAKVLGIEKFNADEGWLG